MTTIDLRPVMDGELRRRELAAFIRSRRERLTPADVGLPPGGRRRTPGLRREEVASLAGGGTTWYTWLEQGRDVRASQRVLESLAGARRGGPPPSRPTRRSGCSSRTSARARRSSSGAGGTTSPGTRHSRRSSAT